MGEFKNFILGILTGLLLLSFYTIYQLHNDIVDLKLYVDQKSDEFSFQKPNSRFGSMDNRIEDAVERVTPTVVGINVLKFKDETIKRKIKDPFGLLSLPPVYRLERQIREVKSNGSGFIITDDGYILTNEHVIHNASEVLVTTTEGVTYEASIVGADEKSDVAILKIDVEGHPAIRFGDSNSLRIGEWVLALGNPYGLFEFNNRPLVTLGIVSGLGINFGNSRFSNHFYSNMIQTDASINPGNSGGPLINSSGEVIGLNTMIYSENGKGSVGIGFVTPISKVLKIKDQLIGEGYVNRAIDFGFDLVDLNSDLGKGFSTGKEKGVYISAVHQYGSAISSGLKSGDIIVGLENYDIRSINDINNIITELKDYIVGDSLSFIIDRGGKILKIDMKLLPIKRLDYNKG